jgi:cytochrome c553
MRAWNRADLFAAAAFAALVGVTPHAVAQQQPAPAPPAAAPAAAPQTAAAPLDAKKLYLRRSCVACHGKDGQRAIQDYPSLAGQRADYMIAQIEDIIAGKRVGGADASGNPRSKGMRGALVAPDGARRITVDEVRSIATWLAEVPALPADPPPAPLAADKLAAAGKLFAEKCEACHGAEGRAPMEGFPAIGGQKRAYVLAQMLDIKSGARSNGQSEAMKAIVDELSPADMELLAAYVALQDPTIKK